MTTLNDLKLSLQKKDNSDLSFSDADIEQDPRPSPEHAGICDEVRYDSEGFYTTKDGKNVRIAETLSVIVVAKTRRLSCFNGSTNALFTSEACGSEALVKNLSKEGGSEVMTYQSMKDKYVQVYGREVKEIYTIKCIDTEREGLYTISLKGSSLYGTREEDTGLFGIADRECPFHLNMGVKTDNFKGTTYSYATFTQTPSGGKHEAKFDTVTKMQEVTANLRKERDDEQERLKGEGDTPVVGSGVVPNAPPLDRKDVPF